MFNNRGGPRGGMLWRGNSTPQRERGRGNASYQSGRGFRGHGNRGEFRGHNVGFRGFNRGFHNKDASGVGDAMVRGRSYSHYGNNRYSSNTNFSAGDQGLLGLTENNAENFRERNLPYDYKIESFDQSFTVPKFSTPDSSSSNKNEPINQSPDISSSTSSYHTAQEGNGIYHKKVDSKQGEPRMPSFISNEFTSTASNISNAGIYRCEVCGVEVTGNVVSYLYLLCLAIGKYIIGDITINCLQ